MQFSQRARKRVDIALKKTQYNKHELYISNPMASIPPSLTGSQRTYKGYSSPNYTPVPDELFDEQLPDLSGAELKVLLYVIRRTFGFKKDSDNISLNQMLHGIITKEGDVLDRGTGLSKKTLLETIKSLVGKNLIITERRRSEEKGDEPTTYRLNIVDKKEEDGDDTPRGVKSTPGGVVKNSPGGRGKNSPTQETVLQQTDLQHRDISRSTASKNSKEPTRPPTASLIPITSLLLEKQALFDQRKNNRFSKSPPPEIEAAIRDVSAKLSDQTHIRENLSQTTNLYRAWGGVNGSSFASYAYEACAITRQQAQVKKQMPYFFKVLKGLLGLTDAEQGSIAPG